MNNPNEPDVLQNAGRCDWCGEMVEMDGGDQLLLAAEETFGNGDRDISPQDAANAIADCLERAGGPKDAMLADVIRDDIGFRLHRRCYEESAMTELPRGMAGETDA